MLKGLVAALSIALALALTSTAALAAPPAVEAGSFPLSFTEEACGMTVDFEATVHYVVFFSETDDGRVRVREIFSLHGTGIGEDGSQWVTSNPSMLVVNLSTAQGERLTVSAPFSVLALSKGGGANLRIHGVFHVTWLDGELVSAVEWINATCA